MQRVIFHIDMNSYFASVEQQANPHLRGRPVGVCEHLGGIIIAPSVEAKRLGIKTGCPVWEAQKIYPQIILLPVDPPKYREITRRFLKIFSDYTDLVERYSIDEAFLDVTDWLGSNAPQPPLWQRGGEGELKTQAFVSEKIWGGALLLALEIKQRIKKEIGEWLTCSVGCGPNKLVAKIASDLDKPDGATVVKPWEVSTLYDRLCLTDIPGIAEKMQRRLNALGIFSVRDLADYPESRLRANFGIVGHYLHEMGNFRSGERLVAPEQESIKSMGHAYTLPRATTDERVIKKLFFKLSEKVAVRLRQRNLWGSVVSCYARFSESPESEKVPFSPRREPSRSWSGFGRSHRLGDFINDGRLIFKEALRIFRSFRIESPLRMAGVTVSGLTENIRNEPLFERYKKPQRLLAAMDKVNGKYGEFTLRRAALLDASNLAPDTVGFPGSRSSIFLISLFERV